MKVSRLVALLFFTGSICLGLASCGGDDVAGEGSGGGDPVEKPTHAFVYYEVTVTSDLISAADVKAVYINEQGLNDTVPVNKTVWSKVVRVAVPFSGKVKALFSKKEGFEPTKDSYKMGIGGTASYNYNDGESFVSNSVTGTIAVPKNQLEIYFTQVLPNTNYEWKVEVKK